MTSPTGPVVGAASVAITPSTAGFTPQLQAALQSAMQAVSRAADEMGDDIARGIQSGVVRARVALNTLGEGLNERLRVTVDVSGDLNRGLLGIGANAVKAGTAIGALGAAMGSVAFTAGALLGTLSQLSGIMVGLPAVVGSAALVMGTLKIATQGVGEAFGAAITGDTEAFTAALEELSPAARELAFDVQALSGRFKDIKTAVQDNFFAPMTKSFETFSKQATDVAQAGLPRISSELGNIASEFLRVGSSGTLFGGLRTLIDETVSGLQRWRGVSGQVADALGNLFKVGAQFSGDMIAGIGGVVEQFAAWINTASQTGELQARLQSALDAFAQLGRIIGNVADIFGAFWFAAQESGANFLGVLEQLTSQFATFLNSDAGIESLTALMNAGASAVGILGDAIGGLLPVVGQLVLTFSTALVDSLVALKPGIDAVVEGLALFGQEASGGIAEAMKTIAGVFSDILVAASPLLPVLGQLVGLLAEHFAAVLQVVAPLVVALLNAIQPMVPVIADLASRVLTAFVNALSAIFTAIEPLIPVLVELAVKVLTMMADHFIRVFEAVEPLIPVIIELASKGFEILANVLPVVLDAVKPLLPIFIDIAKELGSALAPILPVIADAFKEIFNALRPVLPQLAELAGDILVTAARLFTALVRAVAPLLPPLIEIATMILATLMPAFNDLLTALEPLIPVIGQVFLELLRDAVIPILQAILPMVPILVDAFIQLLPSLVALLPPLTDIIIALTPIITLFAQFATVILQVVAPAIATIIIAVNELRNIALTLLAAAIDALVVTVKIAWEAIVAAIQIAWLIIKGIFDTIISVLQGDFSEAWRRLQRLVEEVWNKLKEFITGAIGDIVDYIVEWGPKLYTAGKDAFQRIWDGLDEVFGGLLNSFKDKIVDVVKWVGAIKGAIMLFFMDAGKWLYNIGKDVIQGFINGIIDKAEDLYNALKGILDKAKGLWDGATGWLTGSPSRWTTQRGEWVVEGFANGVENQQNAAVRATQDLINAAKQPFTTAADAGQSGLNLGTLLGSAAAPVATAAPVSGGASIVFGQGSVVVSFEGVVPSESEAFNTGRAVGAGISEELARRDARLAVRVM